MNEKEDILNKEICLQELCKRYSLKFEGQNIKIEDLGFVNRSTNCKSIRAQVTSERYAEGGSRHEDYILGI